MRLPRVALLALVVACTPQAPAVAPIIVPIATATAAPAPSTTITRERDRAPAKRTGACDVGTAEIPAGSFTMARRGDVKIAAFCFDVTEVTAAAYASCVDAKRCDDTDLVCDNVHTYRASGKENHPINCVTPAQAAAYCAAQDKRLPSSMEWEWAGRGADRGTAYAWGDDEPDDAHICWRGHETCAVGSHPRDVSPQGVVDLGGNLVEFTSTPMLDGSGDPEYRGGSWAISTAKSVRADDANGIYGPHRRGDAMGFRCAHDLPRGDR